MENDEYSTDEGKRKRDKEGNIFGKSLKIARTPTKTNKNGEEKLDLLIDMVKDLNADIHQIKKEQEENGKKIKQILDENEDLRKENAEIKLESKQIKEELTDVKEKIEILEKEKRRNNIVMTGIIMETSDKNKLKEAAENVMKRYLEVDVLVKDANKLGERACLIELGTSDDKVKVMKNKHRLNKIRGEKIYIKTVRVGYNKVNIDGTDWNKSQKKLVQTHTTDQKN